MYKIDNLWEPTLQHRELYSMLYGDLNGKKIQKRGDIYIYIHTHTHQLIHFAVQQKLTYIVKQRYSNKILK